MPSYQISLNRHTIAHILATVIALLLAVSLLGQISRYVFDHDSVYGMVQLFDVDGERNLPTYFTVMLAISAAMLLTVIGLASRGQAAGDSRFWFLLAAGFAFLGYDEAFSVHEKMIVPMRQLMGNTNLGIFYFGWVVPGIAGVVVLALFFFRFLLRLPATTRNWMLFSGCLYLGGALVMEMLDGKYMATYGANLMYSVLVTIEEGLEMSGLAAFLYTLLGHISQTSARLEFRLDVAPQLAMVTQPGLHSAN